MSPQENASRYLDLRLVAYFLAIVDHNGYGRAATALRVAQPSLSRQIRRLETSLGVRLFDRGPTGATLTAAGNAFEAEARELLKSADRAAAVARSRERGEALTVGFVGDLIVTPLVKRLRLAHPAARIEARHVPWDGVAEALLGRRVDAVVARLPCATDQLDVTVLREEPRALAVSAAHRLAGRSSVTLDDFADEPMPRFLDPLWSAFWRIDPRPSGEPAPDGPLVATLEDKIELIAAGDAVALMPMSDQVAVARRGLVFIPVGGIEPSQVALASRRSDSNPLLHAFRTLARSASAARLSGQSP